MKVAIVGASGETGQSIVHGLLESSEDFTITALVRPASMDKPEIQQFKEQGVQAIPFDLETSSQEEQVKALTGNDVVICCIIPYSAASQNVLADAAKVAGVKRFVPSAFGSICPPHGIMALREIVNVFRLMTVQSVKADTQKKEDVLDHVKKIGLPYTIIDVGWWYQGSLPRLPSGKIDYAVKFPVENILDNGNLPTALTDLRDIGKYVARIITDLRTINKSVFVYNEIWTQGEIFSLLETLSSETIPRNYLSQSDLESAITAAQTAYTKHPSFANLLALAVLQYPLSLWLRGDNLPTPASQLGYLNGKDLYPEVEYLKFPTYLEEVLAGKGKAPYANRLFEFEDKKGGGDS